MNKKFCEPNNSVDVLVIGFGPVGAAMAALLGRYGVKTLVVDKLKGVLMMPRAIALDNEALRILQMVGLTDKSFARIGIQQVRMYCPYVGEFGYINTSGIIDGHPKLVTFYQPELETALRKQAAKFTSVTASTGLELINIEQTSSNVVAWLQDDNGQVHKVKARYLVGADGANSKVRSLIKQEFQGQTYSQDWLIIDVNKREFKAIDHIEFICDPKRPMPHMPAPGGRERWEFMLLPGEKREEMEKPEKVAELLSRWISHEELNIERQAIYRFHARCCTHFQKDRVFLVGDAAHVTPPFVGQGLVAGLRDAANLSWKLAWVTRGQASTAILDSYDQERKPHAKRMIDLAKLMGQMVMPRNAPLAAAVHGAVRTMRLVPHLRSYFEDMKIKPQNHFKAGLFVPGKSKTKLCRGSQLPQDLVRQGENICFSDDVLGEHLTLVGFGIDPNTLLDDSIRSRWEAIGGQLLHIGLRGQQTYSSTKFVELLGNGFVLRKPQGWLAVVRPDRVIMHDGAPNEAQKIISQCLEILAK